MNKYSNFLAFLNLLIAILTFILMLTTLGGGIATFVYSPSILLLILLVIFLGLINSFIFLRKKGWKLDKISKLNMLFLAVPIVNAFVILVLASLSTI